MSEDVEDKSFTSRVHFNEYGGLQFGAIIEEVRVQDFEYRTLNPVVRVHEYEDSTSTSGAT